MYGQHEQVDQGVNTYDDSPKTASTNGNHQPELPRALAEIQRAQKYTDELLAELGQKLAPVLRPSTPQETGKDAMVYVTEAASTMYKSALIQERFNSQLRDIIDRLEI